MKYYLCQTPDGPQYAATQADAKKIDKNFEIVELDFSKLAMMERLNDLMRQAWEGGADVDGAQPFEGDVGTFEPGNEPQRAGDRPRGDPQAINVRNGERCPVCETRRSIAHWAASSDAEVTIAELLPRVTHLPHLDALFDQIEDQHDELSRANKKKKGG